jgi:hypothetical protein
VGIAPLKRFMVNGNPASTRPNRQRNLARGAHGDDEGRDEGQGKRPGSLFTKPLKIDFTTLFSELTRALLHWTGENWAAADGLPVR